jgi:hypothetical protein
MASQTVDIADDTTKDSGFAGSVAVARSRLRIDARKWLASKLAPKKYDYIQGQQQSLQYYLRELQSRLYVYGTDCLTWGGGTPSLQTWRSIRDQMIARGAA